MERSFKNTRRVLVALMMLATLAVVVLAAIGAYAQSAKTSLKDPVLAQRFNDVSDRLVCQCSCQMIVRVCNHQNCPSAIPIRRQIEKRLQEGATDDEIVNEFVEEHGLKVLSSPPAEGVNLAAWVMPGVAVIFGLIVVGYVVSLWVTRQRLAAATAASPPVSVNGGVPGEPSIRERIEKELSETE
jgi:cytochrome c-type biogenesis protein CcmH/NrfF